MALSVVDVPADQLPEGINHGFNLVENSMVMLHFFWADDTTVTIAGSEDVIKDPGGDIIIPANEDVDRLHAHTSYQQVLDAVPVRLGEMGYDAQSDQIVAQIKSIYGDPS